jgi:hypothetical protein
MGITANEEVEYEWESIPLTPEIAEDIEMTRWMRDLGGWGLLRRKERSY